MIFIIKYKAIDIKGAFLPFSYPNIYNIKPILLLDDVYATLDKKRIQSLTKYVLNMNQTFITTTSILEIPDEILKKSLVIRIDNKKGDSSDGK